MSWIRFKLWIYTYIRKTNVLPHVYAVYKYFEYIQLLDYMRSYNMMAFLLHVNHFNYVFFHANRWFITVRKEHTMYVILEGTRIYLY